MPSNSICGLSIVLNRHIYQNWLKSFLYISADSTLLSLYNKLCCTLSLGNESGRHRGGHIPKEQKLALHVLRTPCYLDGFYRGVCKFSQ